MLPKPHRLSSPRLKEVMRKGKRTVFPALQLLYQRNGLPISRFGFIVSTRIDKRATVRNRFKRLLRESIQNILPSIAKGLDIVVVARSKPTSMTQTIVNGAVTSALTTLKFL